MSSISSSVFKSGKWYDGDDHKMHYPQLPDPSGWDVGFVMQEVADDWLCSDTGPVSDIHAWYSWQNDYEGIINDIFVRIYSDTPDPDGDGPLYSQPNQLLWERHFTDFSTVWYGVGDEGWYEPYDGQWNLSDHDRYYQISIMDINDPFMQEQGTVYWLSLQVSVGELGNAGWKTTQNHWNDDAVYRSVTGGWAELIDPITEQSLDVAFVIAPEPATIALLGVASLALLRRKRSVR